jgi:site-specific DNA-methyltransferase (adenine-specific)
MASKHTCIIGDSRTMAEIKDSTIQLVVTSPPYWQIKDYGESNQIGFNQSYEDYINNLNLVWNECSRVLEDGCRLCINIGDQFARSVYYGRYKIIPIRTEIIKFCETIDFDYMGAIIWQKVTTTNTTGGATIMGSYPYPRNGILKLDYEFILIFKKGGKPKPIDKERKKMSKISKEEWNEYFSGHWNFSGNKQYKHLAMFPMELPSRLIKMFTFVGDTVLDPFLGSGTTLLSAKNLGRNSVGFEVNENFVPIIKEKVGFDDASNIGIHRYYLKYQKHLRINFKKEIKNLPYVFRDSVKMNRKIDFSSKKDTEYYTVKNILSPDLIELNNGLIIKLIGIQVKEDYKANAIEYLTRKIDRQKVFIKCESKKYEKENYLLCYLYLKNKTFINAHLIKSGLVSVDDKSEYKHKNRFLKYRS